MDIKTKDGIDIFVLPESARCLITGEHLFYIDECPMKNFDDFGDICVPEMCREYTE